MSSLFKRAVAITLVSTVLIVGAHSIYFNNRPSKAIRTYTGAALLKHNGKYKDKSQFGSSVFSRILPFLYEEKGVNDPFGEKKAELFKSPTKPNLSKDSFFSEVKGEDLAEKLRLACKSAYEQPSPTQTDGLSSTKGREVNRYCTGGKGKLKIN